MANYELSNRIYELRIQKGLSQKELGAILGVSNKAVSKWETGTAIPKTETLIKLAEVFEISTEELINTACQEENKQTKQVQKTPEMILNGANAIVGKSLSEFRAEKGLYIKDIAEKIGVDEDELKEIEESGFVPEETADKLVVAYNLSKNDFARLVVKSPKERKKDFIRISTFYQIIIGVICAIPSFIGGILESLGMLLDSYVLKETSWFFYADIHHLFSPIVITVGGIILAKHLTEKSGYIGDFNKYKFLYSTIPVAVANAFTGVGNFVAGLVWDYLREIFGRAETLVFVIVPGIVSLIFSVGGTVIMVWALATLIENVVETNIEKKRNTLKQLAIIVTVSALIAFGFDALSAQIKWEAGQFIWIQYNSFDPIRSFLLYGLEIALAWMVYLFRDGNPKMQKRTFKLMPILCIWDMIILECIAMVGMLLESGVLYICEKLLELMGIQ